MNLQRLKFAWARGARIEIHVAANTWSHMSGESFLNLGGTPDYRYRIHPDDAHLEYGPLSSALRDMATLDCADTSNLHHLAARVYLGELLPYSWQLSAENDRTVLGMFALLLAEQLADEGL